ncbi:uncharacterized protein KNAG_0A01700 [Huiozyma naganishii CBS 8797]|uniref:Uncharacterized protein n=1 Tax=Huiozyma naganishii (strain ATCC MYA-139 / BCRC 22969 / CBS 8797 / KCTC 17520 / NBRC 10181 / NCYC 3082 / Yp74L-3) TaxID=1071383 RepID=J7S1W1_HUIN7|nr:hypothetical protein KNAG_0A01700 [Kazachstania naganishii CBS 8797]CCK67859.1 hypothetical protein KNAG_0A01700 [Kazachstania naganishii CBS 8797]
MTTRDAPGAVPAPVQVPRARKPQSAAAYAAQLEMFQSSSLTGGGGPPVCDPRWMDKAEGPEGPLQMLEGTPQGLDLKHTRLRLLDACSRLYYRREYARCIALAKQLEQLLQGADGGPRTKNKEYRELATLRYLVQRCTDLTNSITSYVQVPTTTTTTTTATTITSSTGR